MDKPKCKTCAYWMLTRPASPIVGLREDASGDCHRRAPTGRDFPSTFGNDFCGEHQDFPVWIDAKKREALTSGVKWADLNLSVRASNALRSEGIESVADLINRLKLREP